MSAPRLKAAFVRVPCHVAEVLLPEVASVLDHFVGACERGRRQAQTERLGGHTFDAQGTDKARVSR
jgi:hypothetical protein